MRDSRSGWAWLLGAVVVAPLLILPLRALADVWRAPALIPQQFGGRAFDVIAAPGTGIAAAVRISLVVAAASTVVALGLAWPAARWIAARSPRQRAAVLTIVILPLLVPSYAAGVGLTRWLLRLGLTGTTPGLVTAHLVYVLPYVVLLLVPAFGSATRRLEEAAGTLGARWWRRTWHVTLPTVTPYVVVASLIGFVVSWSQYGTSLAVGGGRLTLPVILLPYVGRDPQVAAAMALVFAAPPVIALAAAVRKVGEVTARNETRPPRPELSR
ncbi:MAG: ABC transporter permease subunit [Actinobacteria bacterium]|nr:ABC transporter permease subunit [Actinomycetota bacterium]